MLSHQRGTGISIACHIKTKSEDSEEEYAFTVTLSSNIQKIDIIVKGSSLNMTIESGAGTNVIDDSLWGKLTSEKVRCSCKKCKKNLYALGTPNHWMYILESFIAPTSINNKDDNAKFIVTKRQCESWLGRDTVECLGVLNMDANINCISSIELIIAKYSKVFQCIHK